MPYITKDRREYFKEVELEGLSCITSEELTNVMFKYCEKYMSEKLCENATQGDLNYCISMLCKGFLNKYGLLKYKRCDEVIRAFKFLEKEIQHVYWNDIRGTVECAKLELYRKVIAPYEDFKEKENGSI